MLIDLMQAYIMMHIMILIDDAYQEPTSFNRAIRSASVIRGNNNTPNAPALLRRMSLPGSTSCAAPMP
jgi:hypothetical protein